MLNFFKSVKFKIAVSVLAALLLGVFVAAVSSGGSSPLTGAVNKALAPLNGFAARLEQRFSGFFAGFRSSSYYLKEIAARDAEIDRYREELVDYEKQKQKLRSYEAFLGVKSEHTDFTFVPATVVLRDTLDIYKSFTIDRGKNDGVDVNMPVLYGKNLIGVVREVSSDTAVVYTLYHPDVSFSAYEIRTREDCYTEADNASAREGSIKLMGLSRTTPVVSGGIVCTSGIGGVCPRDLVIGTVTQVVNSGSDISAYALVKPAADLGGMVDVFVLTDFAEKRR